MKNSQRLFARAQLASSRRRQFAGARIPLGRRHAAFLQRGKGARIWDADGKSYIDYVGSWGPLVVGHAHPDVVEAVGAGGRARLELRRADRSSKSRWPSCSCKLMPSIEQVRLVSSGTEATMTAIRLARGFTGRSKIVKFEGCYHGHADALLVKAGSGALTFGQPSSAGVPAEVARHTLVLDYNDMHRARARIRASKARRSRRSSSSRSRAT